MPRHVRIVCGYLLLILFLVVCFPDQSRGQQETSSSLQVYVVPFSHLDLAWACTQEECLSRGDYIIRRAVELAEKNPQFRFVLESEVFIENFVASHRGTGELDQLKQLVKEGRIEIAPLWADIYQNQTRGEALIRNLTYGKRYARSTFGVDPSVAQLTDIPGFTRQYPQILTKSSTPYMVMTRMGPRDLSIFHWKAPDGSSILVWNTINGYGWGVNLGLHLALGADRLNTIHDELQTIAGTARGPVYMGWGTDLYAPSENLFENLGILNRRLAPTQFRFSTAQEFFRAAAASPSIASLSGEIPSSWANLTTSLVPLWLPAMKATDTLVAAEKFAAINYALGYADYPDRTFEYLWKQNLRSLDHNNDGQGGAIGDERKLGYAREAELGAGRILRDSLRNIAERVRRPAQKNVPIVVFNSQSWKRGDVVNAHLTLFGEVETNDIDEYKTGMRLVDANGTSIPFQLEQYSEGSSRSLEISFLARGVPSFGYKTYYLVPSNAPEKFGDACEVKLGVNDPAGMAGNASSVAVVENEYYRVAVDRATGHWDVFDKQLNRAVSNKIEIVAAEEQDGDDQSVILRTGRTISSVVDAIDLEENGPIRTVLRIKENLAGIPVKQRLTLYRSIKKIDIENTIEWKPGRSVSIEQRFPILQPRAEVRNGIPFGTAVSSDMMPNARPHWDDEVKTEIWRGWRQIQDWVFAGTEEWGFTIGADHNLIEVGDNVVTADMLRGTTVSPLTTMRNGRTIPDWRPPEGAYTFRYSFTSSKGNWADAKAWQFGMAFSAPLVPVQAVGGTEKGPLPPEDSFLSFDAENVVLSAMKKADDGGAIVIRAFEIEGVKAESAIQVLGRERRFRETNLLEENLSANAEDTLRLKPFDIDTLKVTVP